MRGEKIPVGFSNNDFFYKNVNNINIESNPWGIGTTNDLCSKNNDELKTLMTSYLKNLNIEMNKYNGLNTTMNTNNTNKNELVNKMVDYYKAICNNKILAKKLMQTNSQNSNGELKYQDAMDKYNREYLNRINLGIGILFIVGIISNIFFKKSLPKILPITPTVSLPK